MYYVYQLVSSERRWSTICTAQPLYQSIYAARLLRQHSQLDIALDGGLLPRHSRTVAQFAPLTRPGISDTKHSSVNVNRSLCHKSAQKAAHSSSTVARPAAGLLPPPPPPPKPSPLAAVSALFNFSLIIEPAASTDARGRARGAQ